MPYPNEHAARIADPKQFETVRRENDKFGAGIDAIWGVKDGKVTLQAIRFDRKKYTAAEAKTWLKEHEHKTIMFEAASETSNNQEFQSLRFNAQTAKIRYDKLHGKQYLVVPMVMMMEGVHAGTWGALYYPKGELAKTPAAWNHKPVVVYHPFDDGDSVSACTPDVLNTQQIGIIMNAKWDGKLKAEAWIDEDLSDKVDVRVLDAVRNKKTLELSTGLFTDVRDIEGEWNGEQYEKVAVNYRPDHLAVLPDMVGACSVSDGAGFLRNEANNQTDNPLSEDWLNDVSPLLTAMGVDVSKLTRNEEIGHEAVRELIVTWLSQKFKDQLTYAQEIFDDHFVYSKGGHLYSQKYGAKDGKLSVTGIPVEVVRVIKYETKSVTNRKDKTMDRDKMIVEIIANGKAFTEADKELLGKMDDAALEKVHAMSAAPEKPAENKAKEEEKPKAPEAPAVLTNTEQPKTVEDYIANAPAEMQGVLRNGLSAYKAEKTKLITVIKANKKCTFTSEQLEAKDIAELKAIAAFAIEEKPQANNANFSGQGDPAPLDNEAAVEPLVMPGLYEKKA